MKMSYLNLVITIGVHFVVMYALMYLMVNSANNIYLNLNTFYMTGAMATPMAILMLLSMRTMYRDPKLNAIYLATSVLLFGAFFYFTRMQTFVGDVQFIKSMIPHHSGAILMCDRANLRDAELKSICEKVMIDQQREIDQMEMILKRLQTEG